MSGECAICGRVYGIDDNFGRFHEVYVDMRQPYERYFGLCEKHYTELMEFFHPSNQTTKEVAE